jgi:uncharacterized protein (UPF0276 family)
MKTHLGAGVGLKPEHYDRALACTAPGLWFEVHAENYMVDGGPRLEWLGAIRERHEVSIHGVGLSLAADAPPCRAHLRRLARLTERLRPALISEHLAWSAWRGAYYPDLLPFPRTSQALARIADNVNRTQDALGRRIAVENPAHYLRMPGTVWDEIDFLSELVRLAGCGLLLDVNNVHVSAHNLRHSAEDYLDAFPLRHVDEIHLAGHGEDGRLGADLLIDSHDAPVAEAVWRLFERVTRRGGPRPTLIERDGNLPAFAALMAERERAAALMDRSIRPACGAGA